MELMTQALDQCALSAEAREAVLDFFSTTATFMINAH